MRLPLPNGKDVLHRLKGSKFFGRIDLRKGFHQIPLHEKACYLTAFTTPFGLYEYITMPFGLQNPAGYLQKQLEIVLQSIPECVIYIDDILIHAETFELYIERLDSVLNRLDQHDFVLSKAKCAFNLSAVEYLGHVVSPGKLAVASKTVDTIQKMKPPRTFTELRSFLGLGNYFRKFVKEYARITEPLNRKLRTTENPTYEPLPERELEALSSSPSPHPGYWRSRSWDSLSFSIRTHAMCRSVAYCSRSM